MASDNKTEKPTAHRLREAKKQGQIARSPDVGAWVGVFAATFVLEHTVDALLDSCRELLIQASALMQHPDQATAVQLLGKGLKAAVLLSLPLALTLMVVGIAMSGAQGGIHFTPKKLKPTAERLNLVKGVKRMVGAQSAWELVKQLAKSSVVGFLVWREVRRLMPLLVGSGHLPLDRVLATVGEATLSMMRITAGAALVLAAADFAVQKRRLRKQLMMSRQDVQEEYKRSEGDPKLKGAIRSRALALSRNRMMTEVADADVVLVNPTHVAVALKYDATKGAPRVVAKGAGVIAARIRAIATEKRVPLVEDVPLARALHRACEVGQEIPAELYTAVARVLAFVMSLRARGSAAGVHHVPRPRQLTHSG